MGRKVDAVLLEQAIGLYISGASPKVIGKRLPISHGAVEREVARRGIGRCRGEATRVHQFNSGVFDCVDDEAKAYWLGLLMADGTVRRKSVRLKLQRRDRLHVEAFATFLGTTHPVIDGEEFDKRCHCVRKFTKIEVYSTSFAKSLARMGVTVNKTGVETFPPLSEDLIRHFARGYFDGDGSIGLYMTSKSNTKQPFMSVVCQCKFFLQQWKQYAEVVVGPCGSLYQRPSGMWAISFGGRLVVTKLADWLYEGSTVHLERKHHKYTELLQHNAKVEDLDFYLKNFKA